MEPVAEFSRPTALPRHGESARERIAAGEAERAALARRFGLLALDRLEAQVTLTRLKEGARLDASFEAELVQQCVVTLDPIRNRVAETFSLVYGEAPPGEDEDVVAEPLEGESVDVGEAVAQQLSLALDPYPRAPGAELETGFAEDAPHEHPFAALTRLKKS